VRLITVLIVLTWISALTANRSDAESVLLKREGGVLVLPVQVNDRITLDFTIDSGAADVVIPADVFSTLSRTGTITSKDMMDSRVYELADGSRQEARRFRIRSLKIGNLELRNIVGSVTPAGGTLLLGQSFLSHLPSWSIDNLHGLLVIADAGSHGESQSSAPDSPDSGTLSSTVQGQPASADDFDKLSACLAANAKSPEAQRLTMLGFLGGGKRTLVQLTDEHIATTTDSRVAVTYLRNNDACSPIGPLPPDRFKKILLEFSNGILSYGDTNLALVKWRQDLQAAATRAQEQEQKCMAVATIPRDRLNCINIAEKESAVD
jgi:clan AA aspartic protease (TIGR02281 family)